MTKFVHVRNYTWDGAVHPTGGHTIAYEYNPDTRVAAYAVAHCSPKDHYNKKIGRAVSSGRLGKSAATCNVPEGAHVADAITRHWANDVIVGDELQGEVGAVEGFVVVLSPSQEADLAPSSTEPTVH